MMQGSIKNIEEALVEKKNRGKKIMIFVLKVLLLFAMPVIVSILDHFFI